MSKEEHHTGENPYTRSGHMQCVVVIVPVMSILSSCVTVIIVIGRMVIRLLFVRMISFFVVIRFISVRRVFIPMVVTMVRNHLQASGNNQTNNTHEQEAHDTTRPMGTSSQFQGASAKENGNNIQHPLRFVAQQKADPECSK